MVLNSKSIFSGFSYNNYIIIITFKIKYTFNMITISNKSNITFLSFRKIKLNIIYTMFILSKNISITRVFLIIIILRLRIRITINIILLNRINEMSVKMIKTNTKLFPICFIQFIPRTRSNFNNRFTVTNFLKRNSYLCINVGIFFFTVNNITKSINYMTENEKKIRFVINVYVSFDNTRQNIRSGIKTISPKITSKISAFKNTFIVITKTKTWMFVSSKRTGNKIASINTVLDNIITYT